MPRNPLPRENRSLGAFDAVAASGHNFQTFVSRKGRRLEERREGRELSNSSASSRDADREREGRVDHARSREEIFKGMILGERNARARARISGDLPLDACAYRSAD